MSSMTPSYGIPEMLGGGGVSCRVVRFDSTRSDGVNDMTPRR